MIQRILPVVIGLSLLISGCAKKQEPQDSVSFSMGATLLKVAHLPSPIADGSDLFITVDGKEAGQLPVGEAMLLQVPAGEHEVGGYARSLIGRVTIPGLKVTTVADQPRFVAYRVARNTPLFSVRGIDPLPKSAPLPEKQVAQSEPVPVPEITQISPPAPESTPESTPADSSEVATPANQESATPAVQNETPKASTSADSEATVTPAASDPSPATAKPSADAESPAAEKPKQPESTVSENAVP
ncbi:hypothetical protein [Klebsiella sp. BIGb0407]|uniref:hypothetical protein n=1 Tax=Klebsiella sp. BIGb0407 TaxID=2940603 RepID=UPI0021679304|nr:hypothetical protein [Klebsiella sp. BIGb0407]MCS3433125.1 hypothetical protein [Klebsiella sp. BIGb0407]